MIQRIQSVYITLSMVSLSILLTGMEIITFTGNKYQASLSTFGIEKIEMANKQNIIEQNYPFYLSIIGLILYAFILLMRYKNLKQQLKMIRRLFFIYFLIIASFLFFSIYGAKVINEEEVKTGIGIGFLFFIIPFPFFFLAQLGIKRDKKLLDSLDRLR